MGLCQDAPSFAVTHEQQLGSVTHTPGPFCWREDQVQCSLWLPQQDPCDCSLHENCTVLHVMTSTLRVEGS